jgi:hypothetical protein
VEFPPMLDIVGRVIIDCRVLEAAQWMMQHEPNRLRGKAWHSSLKQPVA